MGSKADQTAGNKRAKISRQTFSRVSLLAVLMAMVLVGLGLLSSSTDGSDNPSYNPAVPTEMGSPDAPVTIIEFADFQCYYSQQFALTTQKQLEAEYIDTGKARLVYKFAVFFGEESLLAGEAAMCAAEQGQFWPYYNLLMQQHASPSAADLTVEKLQGIAQQLGLNMETFNDSLLSRKYETRVIQDDAECRALGVNGVPVFFINGTKVEGALPLEYFKAVIDPILEEEGS